MLTVLIQALVLAAGGIVSVGSITIVILLLISDQGWHNGLAYMTGYVGSYTLIGIGVVVIGGNMAAANPGGGGTAASILFVALGLLLLWVTLRNWRKPRSESSSPPRFLTTLDKITPLRALAFGALVTVINFKNLAIFLSAVSVLVLSDLLLPSKIGLVILVTFVFCASVIAPVLIYLFFPGRAHERLNWIRETLEKQSRPIGIWVPLVFGLIFLIRGVTGLL